MTRTPLNARHSTSDQVTMLVGAFVAGPMLVLLSILLLVDLTVKP